MGKSSGLSDSVQQGQLANSNALVALAQQQAGNSQSLFNLTEPGLAKAENFESTLASGDPYAISRAISPAVKQINQSTDSAKKNIIQNAPAGGEKALALEQADVFRERRLAKPLRGHF